ncbi:unnamed protein product [Orchesella dallaii]|uniref:N-acetyltransferase domain-containing protein n=1 Tax=Orchesella dallaii TaxID=48710 RepID=A0ABP1QHG5_9HEXA
MVFKLLANKIGFPWGSTFSLVKTKTGILQRHFRHQNLNASSKFGLQLASSRSPFVPAADYHTSNPVQDKGSQNAPSSNIEFAIVPKERAGIISRFLENNYHKTEPITIALGMPENEIYGWFPRFINAAMFSSVCDISVEAVDVTMKKRIAVLSSIIRLPESVSPNPSDFTDPAKHPVNAQMNEFFAAVDKGIDPVEILGFRKEGVVRPKKLEHMYMVVRPEYAGQKIGSRMVSLAEAVAQNINNCRVGYAYATSEFSYKIFSKHGYKVVNEIKYADYVNKKGEKIFAGKEALLGPHLSCRFMVKELPCMFGDT